MFTTRPLLAAPFMDFYPGGWQELFPNAGNNCVYKGAELGFHGEICKVPWEFDGVGKQSSTSGREVLGANRSRARFWWKRR